MIPEKTSLKKITSRELIKNLKSGKYSKGNYHVLKGLWVVGGRTVLDIGGMFKDAENQKGNSLRIEDCFFSKGVRVQCGSLLVLNSFLPYLCRHDVEGRSSMINIHNSTIKEFSFEGTTHGLQFKNSSFDHFLIKDGRYERRLNDLEMLGVKFNKLVDIEFETGREPKQIVCGLSVSNILHNAMPHVRQIIRMTQ